MLITKEQQEALVDKYIKENHNQDECIGFIDGLNAMLKLVEKNSKIKNRITQLTFVALRLCGYSRLVCPHTYAVE